MTCLTVINTNADYAAHLLQPIRLSHSMLIILSLNQKAAEQIYLTFKPYAAAAITEKEPNKLITEVTHSERNIALAI